MFADGVIESSPTTGTGTYELVAAVGSGRRFQQDFADGAEVAFYATTLDKTKWEFGTGVLTVGPPCTLTRATIRKSSNAGAKIDWLVTDQYLVYSIASADVLAGLMAGNLATTRPWWVRAGSRWLDYAAGLAVSWVDKLATGAEADVRVGIYDVVKDAYFPDSRRPSVAVGAANKILAASDIGGCFSYNTTAGARTVTLPPGSTVKDGYTTSHVGLDVANGLVFTPDAGDGIEGGADGGTLTVPGKVPVSMRWDAARDTWASSYVPAQAPNWAGRRQTVAAGRVDTSGFPNILPASSVSLNLTTDLGGVSLAVAAANGWLAANGRPNDLVGYTATNFTWSSLTASRAAATPNFLYVVVNADGSLTPGKTLLAPIYQWGGTPATTSGQFTFNISEMKGYLGNGTTAPQTNAVFLGEAATDGSTVISTVTYAYNGQYASAWTTPTPAGATATSRSHNLGTAPRDIDFIVECLTTDAGYAVGEQIHMGSLFSDDGSVNVPPSLSAGRNAMSFIGASTNAIDVLHKTTSTRTAIDTAKWQYRMTADRGWG